MAGPLIALTFDDGPNTVTTVQVLDKLEQHGITATFFVVGENVNDDTRAVMLRARRMGCEINNHSMTHPDLASLDEESIKKEVQGTSEKICQTIGETPVFVRPPYFSVSPLVLRTISQPLIAGLGVDDWIEEVSAEERTQKVLSQAADGAIILLHDTLGNVQTVEALDGIITGLKDRGFGFATVSQLFKFRGIQPQPHKLYIHITD